MESQQNSDTNLSDVRLEPTNFESAYAKASDALISPTPGQEGIKSSPHRPGSIVGNRYMLQSWLGAGRLGVVYEAVDQQLSEAGQRDHCVTIELFTLSSSQTVLGVRFACEFVDLLSISHPNIARIIDFGIDGTTIFFTMELLEGASLRSILDSNSTSSFTENEVLAVLGNVADALRHVHAKGFVHGNLKPESIFVTSNYEVKIADFASVVLMRVNGNIAEQRSGSAQSLNAVDDIFGLASVAYEMLSNERPFGDVPPLEARRTRLKLRRIKGVPRYRWKALSRALSLRPEKRTPSIAEFAAEFGIIGTESLIEAESDDQPRRRRLFGPLLWLVAAAGAIILIQSNYMTLREVFLGWQERFNAQPDTVLSKKSQLEDPLSEQNDPLIVEKRTGEGEDPPLTEPTHAVPSRETAVSPGVIADGVNKIPALVQSEAELVQAPQGDMTSSESEPVVGQNRVEDEVGLMQTSSTSGNSPVNTEPPGIAFAQETVTVYEGQAMASILVQRRGMVDGEASVTWWTGDNTAIANHDYADLGVRTETFAAGQESLTFYVPLVSDSLIEERESFYVYVGSDLAPTYIVDRLEVVVIDNDD